MITEESEFPLKFKNSTIYIQRVRSNDIPGLIEMSYGDLGFTGLDYTYEYSNNDIYTREEFKNISNNKLCLLVPNSSTVKNSHGLRENAIVVSQYPKIAFNHFNKIGRTDIVVVSTHGASEGYVANGFADGCVDVVETGITAQMNDLKSIEVLFQTFPVLISKKEVTESSNATRSELMDFLISNLRSIYS